MCESWELFHSEAQRLKQMFTNNKYPMHIIETEINNFLNKKFTNSNEETIKKAHKIFYENQMHSNYKTDEKIIKDIIKSKMKCTRENEEVRLNIYYKNRKTRNLIMQNNLSSIPSSSASRARVVYKAECIVEDCELRNSYYIGYTACTVNRRMTYHAQNGAIAQHY